MRNFLRIEYLFHRFNEEKAITSSVWAHHAALATLFEIMECAARAELKLDILQELERQKLVLSRTEDKQSANELGDKIQKVSSGLQGIQQKFGQHLRENDWIMTIKQKMASPGGAGPIDLPSYYFWQQLSAEERIADLNQWIATLTPTYDAISVLLQILRSNVKEIECNAPNGSYEAPSLMQNFHMLRIDLDTKHQVMPEVSANKYLTNVRFLEISKQLARGKQVDKNIPFKMVLCSFSAQTEETSS